jgi:dihydrofolate synthase/folylpolyglutamate synthase
MFAQLPMYQQKGKTAYHSKLDGIIAFTTHLKNPQYSFKSIHVAGTNGKGSSSHMLASILQEAGYKVGLYTSPHLKDFRERIRINGKTVSKKYVVDFIAENRPFLNSYKLSFFEMTVGMAFSYFSAQRVDIAIIEVGLGGRLDSTNIIVPEVSLITNIGYDHMDILGGTLPKIASEKAGIIKAGVPVVISETQNAIKKVFESVAQKNSSLLIFADTIIEERYESSLLGLYQEKNIKGVVAAIGLLTGFKVSVLHIKEGLLKVQENTGLMGRWQILNCSPKIICDTAHNQEGLALVLEQLIKEGYAELHIVLGFVKGKNLENILPLFPEKAHYYFCKPNIPRGLDEIELLGVAEKIGLKGRSYPSVAIAYEAAQKYAKEKDLIFIGGSTFVVAEVI